MKFVTNLGPNNNVVIGIPVNINGYGVGKVLSYDKNTGKTVLKVDKVTGDKIIAANFKTPIWEDIDLPDDSKSDN